MSSPGHLDDNDSLAVWKREANFFIRYRTTQIFTISRIILMRHIISNSCKNKFIDTGSQART